MVRFDPQRPDFSPYGFTCVRWTPSPMARPDHHNEIELNLLHTGSVTYLLGGQKVRVEAGQLNAFWAAIPHQIIAYSGDIDYFVATIPLAWFLQCKLPTRLTEPLLRGELVTENVADRLQLDLALFGQWQRDLDAGGRDTMRITMLEMEARLARLATTLPESSKQKKPASRLSLQGGGLNKVELMACIVAQRYTESLSVAEISREVDLHPNYAMNLFKKVFGTTLVDYITHHRVSHAQRLLATTDDKIIEIAFGSGFNSVSRFNEAFRRACGCTPREYRAGHAISSPVA